MQQSVDVLYVCVSRAVMEDDGTADSAEILVEDDIQTPDGIAFDWIHGNLYWTDTGKNCIEVMSLENRAWRTKLISEDFDEPRAIVVDPRNDHWYGFCSIKICSICLVRYMLSPVHSCVCPSV